MKRLTVMIGLSFILGVLTPLVGGAQERVEAFDRLTGPRIALPNDPQGASPLRQLCPENNDTCRKFWAYTGNFVQNHTIPTRERELLILRTAWLSRGDSRAVTRAFLPVVQNWFEELTRLVPVD